VQKILDTVAMSIWQMALEPYDNSVINNQKQFANGHVSTKVDVDSESESSTIGDDDDSDNEVSSTYVGATYQRLAMACDDGSIRLYNIPDSDALNYLRSFPRVSGMDIKLSLSI
jgi:U3 small nucleolar RNA-associated protein 4